MEEVSVMSELKIMPNSRQIPKNKSICANKKYYDATHNCYAYIIDNGNIQKCSDDGEPNGTAGYPILNVIKKKNLTNTFVAVVRYFGGIKLGAGGLTRAYTKACAGVLN